MDAEFAFGTYGMRVHHDVPVARESYDGAVLAQPINSKPGLLGLLGI